jgi:heme A synthase
MIATTTIRSGTLGGSAALVQRGSTRAARAAYVAAALAILAVALGGLTAKFPGAAVGCTTVPLCGPNPSVEPSGVHIQLTHRTLAVLLVLHLVGMVMMLRTRRESEAPVVLRAAWIALAMVILQLGVASAMILLHMRPVYRSLHEATGIGIWLSCFALAYLASRVARASESAAAAPLTPRGGPVPVQRTATTPVADA